MPICMKIYASFRAWFGVPLRRPDLPELAVGKYPIQGEAVFAVVQEHTTKPVEEGRRMRRTVSTPISSTR